MNIVVCSSVLEYAGTVSEIEFLDLWLKITNLTRRFKYQVWYSTEIVYDYLYSGCISTFSRDTKTSIEQYFHLGIDKPFPHTNEFPCDNGSNGVNLSVFSNWFNCLLDDISTRIGCYIDREKLVIGVYTTLCCVNNHSVPCRRCLVLSELDDRKWLQLNPDFYFLGFYDIELPISGDFPFIPPRDWHTHKDHLGSRAVGFLDHENKLWRWGYAHGNDHWDVTFLDGSHRNILPDGYERGTRVR